MENENGKLSKVYNLTDTVYILPTATDENDGRLEESLKVMASKISKYYGDRERDKAIAKLKEFHNMIYNIKNIDAFKYNGEYIEGQNESEVDATYNKLITVLNNVEDFADSIIKDLKDEKPKEESKSEEDEGAGFYGGSGIISDIKNAPKKIKMANERLSNLENKIESLEQMIKEMKLKDVAVEAVKNGDVKTESETKPEPINVFKIPQLKHVEPVKREPEDEFKDLKDILNKRRQDIEYSDDLDDISEDWDDSYTELTAGSLGDATELIESLRDNYNIVLRMYINKKAKK